MVHKCLETTPEVGITQLHNLGHTKVGVYPKTHIQLTQFQNLCDASIDRSVNPIR